VSSKQISKDYPFGYKFRPGENYTFVSSEAYGQFRKTGEYSYPVGYGPFKQKTVTVKLDNSWINA